jgi:hypothetical protein
MKVYVVTSCSGGWSGTATYENRPAVFTSREEAERHLRESSERYRSDLYSGEVYECEMDMIAQEATK